MTDLHTPSDKWTCAYAPAGPWLNMISREQKPFWGLFIFRRNVGLQRAAAWHQETALWSRVRFQPHHIPNWSLWLSKCLPLSVFSTLSVFSQFLSAEERVNPGISPRNLGDLRVNLGAEITETAGMWWCCQLLQYFGDKKKKSVSMSPWTHEGFKQKVFQAKVQVFSAAVNQRGGNYSYHQPVYAHYVLGYVLSRKRFHHVTKWENEKTQRTDKINNTKTLPDTTNTQIRLFFTSTATFNRCSISINCVFIFQVFFLFLKK